MNWNQVEVGPRGFALLKQSWRAGEQGFGQLGKIQSGGRGFCPQEHGRGILCGDFSRVN